MGALHFNTAIEPHKPVGIPLTPCSLSFAIDADGRVQHVSGSAASSFIYLEGLPFANAFSSVVPSSTSGPEPFSHLQGRPIEIVVRGGETRVVGTICPYGDTGATFLGEVAIFPAVRDC